MQDHYSRELLGLEEVIVKKVIHSDHSVKVYLETQAKEVICPNCGNKTKKVHDYRMQKIKDIPIHMKPCILILKKRRYRCGCGKRFYERYEFLPRYLQRTQRLTKACACMFHEVIPIKEAARQLGISQTTAGRIIDYVRYPKGRIGKVIGIDEFKGNAEKEKFQCILTDPRKHRVIDILPDRKEANLSTYFREIDRNERYRVEYFVCDMWKPYVRMGRTYFPNAKICVDKYHVVRQVMWALERVRKNIQKTMPERLRKYYKRSRKLMLKRYADLKEEERQACDLMLLYNDDLRRAHWLKEKFLKMCEEKRYSVQRADFKDWIRIADNIGLKEFSSCIRCFREWSKEILNAFKYGITNGITEGFNNKIKVIKRVSYGVRKFERFRTRILACTS